VFIERLEPSGRELEDVDSTRLVMAFQAGERDAFAALYARYFDRVYGYLRTFLRPADAEDTAQLVFERAFTALPRYEHRGAPFRVWLFKIARNRALSRLGEQTVVQLDDETLASSVENGEAHSEPEPSALEWISNDELMLFVDRLPQAQRQAIFLRFALDLSAKQVAAVMGRSEDDVRALQSRALRFLRTRLERMGREPRWTRRARIVATRGKLNVLRARRFALH
jgi:RNA polymerase sigma-70 factor (ECF subfamily)